MPNIFRKLRGDFSKAKIDPKVDANAFHQYPCNQADIDDLQDRTRDAVYDKPHVSVLDAAAALRERRREFVHQQQLQQQQQQQQQQQVNNDRNNGDGNGNQEIIDLQTAAQALHAHFPPLRCNIFDATLVFKAFRDLDTVIFKGVLSGNVCLRLKRYKETEYGRTEPPRLSARRVTITINRKYLHLPPTAFLHKSREKGKKKKKQTQLQRPEEEEERQQHFTYFDLMCTLVHEMVHAYTYVCCGEEEQTLANYGYAPEDVGVTLGWGNNAWHEHGVAFALVMREAQEGLKWLGGDWAEIDLGEDGMWGRYLESDK